MQTRKWIGLATAAGAAAAASGAYMRYRHELNGKAQRLKADSFIANTKYGRIEYGREGTGRPALVIHGVGGGYDQGLYLAREMLGKGFDVIAPSRFGYLRTPIPSDASHVAQAHAHAELLDIIAQQTHRITQQSQYIDTLAEMLRIHRYRQFGNKSERIPAEQFGIFDEAIRS